MENVERNLVWFGVGLVVEAGRVRVVIGWRILKLAGALGFNEPFTVLARWMMSWWLVLIKGR